MSTPAFCFIYILAQHNHIIRKSFDFLLCDLAGGQWFFAFKGFFNADVSGLGKFVKLDPEVASSTFGFLFDESKRQTPDLSAAT
jgi:hypothetical protein